MRGVAMGLKCFLNCKKSEGEPSRRRSRYLQCILPSRYRSWSPAARSVASQSPKGSSIQSGEMSPRTEGEDDKAVQVSSRSSFGLQSRSFVELVEVFKKFDVNGDGKLSPSELGELMRSLGGNPTEEELRVIVGVGDLDGDGHINLSEFLALNTEGVNSSRTVQDLKVAFKMFDRDGDGAISPHELQHVLTSLQEPCSLGDCQAMIRRFDCNGDGVISFNEFITMMKAADGSLRRN